jgi:hypothetical protein
MTAQRFTHRRISATEFKHELEQQGISLRTFTRIWCQNLSTTMRWANGQNDIPTWMPIALTMMTVPNAMGAARTAAAAMIEKDTLNPHLGDFPYQRARQLPADEDEEAGMVGKYRADYSPISETEIAAEDTSLTMLRKNSRPA